MQSKINKIGIIVALIFCFTSYSFSQVIRNQYKADDKKKFNEELFVQTDRDIYIAGENVFLKIFKLNGITGTPGNVSKVVYVDLLDFFNNPVVQLKIDVNVSSGSGEFRLPDTLRTGNYLIRSCTSWMRNFSSDLFSYKRISVINPFENINKIKIPIPGLQPDSVAFYPESGSLVSGIETVVGYRSFNRNGNPVSIKGIITDSDSDTLCSVQSDETGTGSFLIKPSGSGKIFLITGGSNGSTERFTLPDVKESGIVFSVKNEKILFKIKIRESENFYDNRRRMYLVYSPVLITPLRKEIGPEESVFIRKDTLPAGLAKVMIVDERGLPLAERWIFNDKMPDIKYNIELQREGYSTRNKIKIDITATDQSGNTVKSDLVVSVVKAFSVDKSNCTNALGYRQLPALAAMNTDSGHFDINDYLIYYSDSGEALKADKTGSDEMPAFLPELGSQIVSGTIRNRMTGDPLNNENIVLSFVGKTARCSFTRTDNKGIFNFVISEYGIKEIVIQPLSPQIKEYYVELNNPFPDGSIKYKPVPFYPDSSMLAEINSAIISMQVKSIYEPFQKAGKYDLKRKEEPDFYGEPVDTILMAKFIELTSLKEVVKEIVPGVSIHKKNGKSSFKIVDEASNMVFDSEPLVLVDGVPINDLDKVLSINPKEMEKIEVLKGRYLISDIIIEGIVHFITKKGNLGAVEFDKSVFRQEFEACQPVYRYSFPDYSVDTLKNNRIPDFRNTLYWNPDLNTDEAGKAVVEFYTSDEAGEYTIAIEGMTSDGRTGKTEVSFNVKSK